nr:MAG TPA: PGC7/Stella/Dppa3 domain protein [Bacteriophage sp.]
MKKGIVTTYDKRIINGSSLRPKILIKTNTQAAVPTKCRCHFCKGRIYDERIVN